ncbi:MAG: Gfo/Idh/MocA family oxidoreductase [Sedimentisphaerales bacterium]|nr:Gfo/Idh/MocA family oxidoreductase [Sedimentisphaerales bacterium]
MTKDMNRRAFLRSAAAVGSGFALTSIGQGQTSASGNRRQDVINVAFIGLGEQGRVLLSAAQKIASPVLHFRAVCDIWDKNRNRVWKQLSKYDFDYKTNAYTDYQDMLDKEKDLDAVIIATPDFWHARQTIDCLNAGLHVYCEKEMSNSLEDARKMVLAARSTGKLLQIGHQRRSNPVYRYCFDTIIKQTPLLGTKITAVSGQWNRSRQACVDLGWSQGEELDEATLNKYGFESMTQFRNWRWYKGLGGGPIVDLGSHQIDVYTWFLETNPTSVVASGGTDYWTGHQWYDNVFTIYEYKKGSDTVRATYQTLTTNSSNSYFESFLGDEGTLVTSEDITRTALYRESWVDKTLWYPWEEKRYIKRVAGLDRPVTSKAVVDPRATVPPAKYYLLAEMNQPFHQPHLQNFFDAVRGKASLTCPAEIGYETAVSVLKVNEAIAGRGRIDFKAEDFKV